MGIAPSDIAFIDAETTGIDSDEDVIIELAGLRVDPITFEVKAQMHELVWPTKLVSDDAKAINGYDENTWANRPAVELGDALRALVPILSCATHAGQNPDFDWRFLVRGAQYHCVTLPPLATRRKIDVGSLAQPLVAMGFVPSTALDTVTSFLRVPGQKHRALADCFRALGVYKILTDTFGRVADQTWLGRDLIWCPICLHLPVDEMGIYCGETCAAHAARHASHGRVTAEDSPNLSHCPCGGTSWQITCARAGCGYCKIAETLRR